MRQAVGCSLFLLAILVLAAAPAGAYRDASSEELAALEDASYEYNDAVPIELSEVRVSTVRRWATAVVTPLIPHAQAAVAVYKGVGATAWRVVYVSNQVCFGKNLANKGMYRAVARDLGIEDCSKLYPPVSKKPFVNRSGCGVSLVYRPHHIWLSCDVTFLLKGIHWIHYGGRVATATARAHVRGCEPSCGSSEVLRPKAKLRLSRLTYCEGHRAYARLRYRLIGSIPDGYKHRGTVRMLPEGGCR